MLKKSFVACLFFVMQLTVFTNSVASQKATQNFSTPATLLTSNSWSPPLQGTNLLANINQTNAGSHPMDFARLGEKVIFSAYDAVHGFEPWITDGSTNGTYLLKDINPSDTSLNPTSAYGFTEINGRSIFIGNDGVNESALWVTDGTSAGTQILKDPNSTCPDFWCSTEIKIGPVFQSKRTVVIDDGVSGPEIWLTDGTSSGTLRITDLPGGSGSFLNGPTIELFGSIGDVLFFAYRESTNGKELWRTDGTISGTSMVKDIAPGTTSGVCGDRAYIANNWILFDGIGNRDGQMCRVWRTDGTEQGTFSLPFLSPIQYHDAHVFDDEIYLYTTASTVNYEWYVTDGSSSAARLVSDINPSYGYPSTDSLRFVTGTSKFIFAASDGISGTELWKSDGTDSGTLRVADISPGSASSMPNSFFSFGEKAIFIADNGIQGKEWWITQGTSSTTQLLKDIGPGSASGATGEWTPSGIALSNTSAVFTANDGLNGPELWVTDGTSSGTRLLKNINEKSAGSNPTGFTQLDDKIVYVADDGVHGRELWATDRQGTRLVKDIYPGSESSSIAALKRFKDLVLFVANNGTNGSELWRTDGTEIGTFRLTDSKPGSESGVSDPATSMFGGSLGFVQGDEFFFAATDSEHGTELWTTQGTVQTTALKADLTVGPSSSGLSYLNRVGNSSLTRNPFSGNWWLINLSSLTLSQLPTSMIGTPTQFASGNLAIFTGTFANTGNEPWVTDGTISGTQPIADIYPGSVSSSPDLYTTFGNQIAFVASNPTEGTEIELFLISIKPGQHMEMQISVNYCKYFLLAANFLF
jgi:ELWxxDGT repeat protein